jgi:hypothetical protein
VDQVEGPDDVDRRGSRIDEHSRRDPGLDQHDVAFGTIDGESVQGQLLAAHEEHLGLAGQDPWADSGRCRRVS